MGTLATAAELEAMTQSVRQQQKIINRQRELIEQQMVLIQRLRDDLDNIESGALVVSTITDIIDKRK